MSLFRKRSIDPKTQNLSKNITPKNQGLEILKTHFSHCFNKQGKFDFDKFKQEVSSTQELDFDIESYEMNWLGKSYARLLASDEATTFLKEDKIWNNKPENQNSQNLLIKGDNLEVLKHLSNSYYEKVKMIYIDPPYNTGSDGFVYQDDRKFSVDELSQLAGISEERAKRILDFTRKKSNSHSSWLTFMYPRLYIAKQLLKEDGVIFVSIDDNEVAQLRLMMDEIFGEENFVEQLIWKKRATPPNDRSIGRIHEHILCYSKNINLLNLNLIPRNKKSIERYSNPDNDPKGDWVASDLSANGKGGRLVKSCIYPIINPATKEEFMPSEGRCWLFNKEKMNTFLLEGRVSFRQNTGAPFLKRYLSEVRDGLTLPTILDNLGYSSSSAIEADILFVHKGVFEYAKPTLLIKALITIGSNSNDLILDFFAGSGTTGDAVMQLNAEDRANGKEANRQYILVQLPEPIDKKKNKTAFDFVKGLDKKTPRQTSSATPQEGNLVPTIFEITKERLIRSAKKIQLEQKNKKDLFQKENNLDLGFKIFETTPNYQDKWENYRLEAEKFDSEDVDSQDDELENAYPNSQLTLFDESQLTAEDLQMLLITWKTSDGLNLTEDLQEIDLGGYVGYYLQDKLYLMDKGFEIKNLVKLLEKTDAQEDFNPKSIIAFGYNFDSAKLREISDGVKNYTSKKQIEIDFIIRY